MSGSRGPQDQGELQALGQVGAHVVASERAVEHNHHVHICGPEGGNGFVDPCRGIDDVVEGDDFSVSRVLFQPAAVFLVALDGQLPGPSAGDGGDETYF